MGMMMGEGAYRPGVRPTGRKWPRLEDELGGFIFITSADAMREARNDGEEEQGVEDKMSGTVTMKFALPAAFAETVAKIALGMPVFLYDVTHRLLHGVYEASPCEEQQSRNSAPANGLRFPAHVYVRRRKEFPPQPDSAFRPYVYHYDGPKFRLELSRAEVSRLLNLFRDSAEQEDGWMKIGSKGQASEPRRKSARSASNSGISGHVSTSAPAPTQQNSHDMNMSPMYKLSASRFCQKVYIPLDEHPGFNFVGLIIGPRGRHQKMLEGTCGAKIAVRGQGGTFHASPRRDGRPDASHDDLHVLVQGESERIVERGVELICKVLRPPDGKTWKPGRQGSVSTILKDLARASHDSELARMSQIDINSNEDDIVYSSFSRNERHQMEGVTIEEAFGKEGSSDSPGCCWTTSNSEPEDKPFVKGDHIEKHNLEDERMVQSPTAYTYSSQRQQHPSTYSQNAMSKSSGLEAGRLLPVSPIRTPSPVSYSVVASKSVLDSGPSSFSDSGLETGVNEEKMLETTALSVAESVWPSYPVSTQTDEQFQQLDKEYLTSVEPARSSDHSSQADLPNTSSAWNINQRLQEDHSAIIEAVRKALICPLSGQVMSDPIVCSDGLTYERKAIEGISEDSSFHPQPVAKNWNLISLLHALQKLEC